MQWQSPSLSLVHLRPHGHQLFQLSTCERVQLLQQLYLIFFLFLLAAPQVLKQLTSV